ncbi:MAG: nucleotide exchange factor GrpE [Planctomycetaceae bacterium]|nr:nucleotide exchange factor GrpE [Planctomycetaceae bacterium]
MNEEHPTDHASQIPGDFVEGVHEYPASASDQVSAAQSGEPFAEERVQQLIEERDAARDQTLRAQAELENYRKRSNRERDEERRFAALPIVRDLLPGLDNLQRAIDAARHTDDLSAMLQGVEMVSAQINEVLTRHGAVPIPSVGEPFDPNKHEAIQQMPSADHPPMTVLDEVERGYTLNDRVIRPSKVIVSVTPPAG